MREIRIIKLLSTVYADMSAVLVFFSLMSEYPTENLLIFLSFFLKNQVSRFNSATSHNYLLFQVILIPVFIYGGLEKFVVCLLMTSCIF